MARLCRPGEQPDCQITVGGVQVRRDLRPGAGRQAPTADAGERLAQVHGGVEAVHDAARTVVGDVADHGDDQRELVAPACAWWRCRLRVTRGYAKWGVF
jgi:hypothetical protein